MNSRNNSSINKQGEPIFPRKLCHKNVTDFDNAILCDLCQTWVHIKCNRLIYMDYKYLQGCNEPWYFLSSTNTLFPFGNLNNQNFLNFFGNNNIITSSERKNLNSSLLLKPPPDLALLFNQFNNAIPENRSDPENVIQSKYYDIDELQKLKIPNKENSLSLFHMNSFSLNKHFEELQNLLQSTNINFDVIAITDTRIPKNNSVTQNFVLNNYSFEHAPTESSAGGTLLYITNRLSHKIRNDWKIYKKN